MPQVRELLARLLRHPAPTAREIAQEVSDVLFRNEQATIYHWHARTGEFRHVSIRAAQDRSVTVGVQLIGL